MKIPYRPEIDGLRAIAVVAVILYHAEFEVSGSLPFAGGYLGVDVFFVISGFLISKIILTELEGRGRFSFLSFYQRRVRRILPILLVVMLASFPLAWIYLLPTAFVEFAQSMLYSLAFVANFFFHSVTAAYGAESSLLKPLLHTWSLSVEEQFYLLFPLLVVGARFVFRKWLFVFFWCSAR